MSSIDLVIEKFAKLLKTEEGLVSISSLIQERPELANAFLDLGLRSNGYNNYKNTVDTGEEYLLSKIIEPLKPSLCLDIGAHTGSFSNMLLNICSTTDVIAFEPFTPSYQKLKLLKKTYGERFLPVNRAIGEVSETRFLYYNPESTSHASFLPEANKIIYINNSLSSETELTSLDEFLFDNEKITNIDFIKIDTEGFEFDVLQGAKNSIAKFKPTVIQVEFNWHHLLRGHTLLKISQSLEGYKPFQLLKGGLVERNPYHPDSNIFHFSNFAFIRENLT